METTLLFWVVFNILVLSMLWLDLKVLHAHARLVSLKEAFGWSLFWIGLSLGFAGGLFFFMGPVKCEEFLTGYIIEKSLSVDNIFVFSLIFQNFSIPPKYQHRILFWGVLGALILRGLMIWFGIALITYFHPIIYALGAFLIFTGSKILWVPLKPFHLKTHPFWFLLQRYIPVTARIEGHQFWVRSNGGSILKRWKATPLLGALVVVECSDIIFAIDSMPAILAITLDPFIVYTSNVFAILGLRSLYFLLAQAVERFYYLKTGIGLILCFVGIKMMIQDFYKMPTKWSLLMILLILGGGAVLSCYRSQKCHK